MVGAVDVLERIERLGVRVIAEGNKLVLEPGSKVPADLLALVREYKAELLRMVGKAELAHRRTVEEITRQMQEHGWCLVWSDTLGEVIAFANDDHAAAQVPGGIVVYTRAELAEIVGHGHVPDTLRLIHEGKKLGGKVKGRSKEARP